MKNKNIRKTLAGRFCLTVMLLLLLSGFILSASAETEEGGSGESVSAQPTEEVYEEQEQTKDGEQQWQTLLSDKVIPITVFGITAIGSVYVAIAPVLNRMKNAAGNMDTAAGGVRESAEASRTATARVEAFHTEAVNLRQEIGTLIESNQSGLAGIGRDMNEKLSRYLERTEKLETEVKKVEEMLAVGLGNTEELVRKGYARVLFSLWEGDGKTETGETEAAENEV